MKGSESLRPLLLTAALAGAPFASAKASPDELYYLSIQPVASTRFVWIAVVVPDDDNDNNGLTPNGTSGALGYRVMRN